MVTHQGWKGFDLGMSFQQMRQFVCVLVKPSVLTIKRFPSLHVITRKSESSYLCQRSSKCLIVHGPVSDPADGLEPTGHCRCDPMKVGGHQASRYWTPLQKGGHYKYRSNTAIYLTYFDPHQWHKKFWNQTSKKLMIIYHQSHIKQHLLEEYWLKIKWFHSTKCV